MLPRSLVARLVLAAPFLAAGTSAVAQPTATPKQVRVQEVPAAPAAPTRGVHDKAELEAFLDGMMAANLRDKHVAGATVSVVKNGQLFFAKGYGFSDVAHRTPVNAEKSMFRIGSISKLFTWTSVMQLVEQGKLDLDTDVNKYIDFKIPDTYPQPITLRAIMSHTPGFEEDGRDLFSDDPKDDIPRGKWLATHIPGRVRPPLTYSSYSNYATALAGYIVERVSGMSWDDYIEKNIINPLGMTQTTGRQPLPAKFEADMSGGYQWTGGDFKKEKYEIVTGAAPAGSIASSATDMAKFMITHLNNGAFGDVRILKDSTAQFMHTRSFTHDPRLPGFALGFYEQTSHGMRAFGHGGDTGWFHSELSLIPSESLGVFVSYNTNTGGELSFAQFMKEFLDHYYPISVAAAPLPADAVAQAQKIAGEYTFNRRSYTTFQKALGLTGAMKVAASDSGMLVLDSPLGSMHLVPVGPLLYRERDSDDLVSFKADPDGSVRYGFMGFVPMMVLERVPWYESPKLHWVVLGLAVIVFVSTIIAAVGRFYRRRWGTPRVTDTLPGRGLLVALALINVVFLVCVVTIVGSGGGLLKGPLTSLKVALVLPILGALLAIAAAFMSVRLYRSGIGTSGARFRYASVVVLALLFVWSLNTWNLLGWRM